MWSKEGVQGYRERLGDRGWEKYKEETVQQCWHRLKVEVEQAHPRQKYRQKQGGNQKRWWTNECVESRQRMRKGLRELRARKEEWDVKRHQYLSARRQYKQVCKESIVKWKKKIEGEVMAIKTEEDFWKFVNKGRRHRTRVRGGIPEEEWVKHFEKQLSGEGG